MQRQLSRLTRGAFKYPVTWAKNERKGLEKEYRVLALKKRGFRARGPYVSFPGATILDFAQRKGAGVLGAACADPGPLFACENPVGSRAASIACGVQVWENCLYVCVCV